MKILVTGATGMLGTEVVKKATGLHLNVDARSHGDLDITDIEGFNQLLTDVRPDIVINCAGIVRGRDDIDVNDMHIINGATPGFMAKACSKQNIKMVQISTDCVFKGDKIHTEQSRPNVEDDYGKSKADGEIKGERHLNIRCSFIGMGKRGLLSWLMRQKGEVAGYREAKWNGMTAPYAAQTILDFAIRDVSKTIHIFGEDTTKHDVLVAANEAFKLGLKIVPVNEPVRDNRLRTVKPYHIFLPRIEKQLEELADAYSSDPSRA